MVKEIVLYNLSEKVTDEQYKDFVINEKGPLIDSLPSVDKYELIKIQGEAPYKYAGIVHINNLDELNQKDKSSQKFQELSAKLMPMLKDTVILQGEKIY